MAPPTCTPPPLGPPRAPLPGPAHTHTHTLHRSPLHTYTHRLNTLCLYCLNSKVAQRTRPTPRTYTHAHALRHTRTLTHIHTQETMPLKFTRVLPQCLCAKHTQTSHSTTHVHVGRVHLVVHAFDMRGTRPICEHHGALGRKIQCPACHVIISIHINHAWPSTPVAQYSGV